MPEITLSYIRLQHDDAEHSYYNLLGKVDRATSALRDAQRAYDSLVADVKDAKARMDKFGAMLAELEQPQEDAV